VHRKRPSGTIAPSFESGSVIARALRSPKLCDAHTPTGAALQHFLQPYARDSLWREAARQCQIAAAAPDAAESLSLIEDVQDLDDA
jgi:hypothetical protein